MSNPQKRMTEKEWQKRVLRYAVWGKWEWQHTFDSRFGPRGFPDLILIRPPELIAAELKTDRGSLSEAQVWWLEALHDCGIEQHVWKPRDEQLVKDRLLRHPVLEQP